MTWPGITINQVNQLQGNISEVERTLLFIGHAAADTDGTLVALNSQSDIDDVLALASDKLRDNVTAAQLNGGQNWQAYALIMPAGTDNDAFVAAVRDIQSVISVEGVVVLREPDVSSKTAEILAWNNLRTEITNKYGRWIWFIVSMPGPTSDTAPVSWSDYLTVVSTTLSGISAYGVQVVPNLWGNEAGVLAGRLCNRSVTIADSPARVATGALLGMGDGSGSLPLDSTGAEVTLATLQALHDLRCSVPMWYPDYEGLYWSDGLTLEVSGGDFQVIEHLRVIDKVARNIRIRGIGKIADRSLNTTAVSIQTYKTFFGRTLREMSRATQINGVTFPGEIEPPGDDNITITWTDREKVSIGVTARPYACPKQITVNIALDNEMED
ncbi:DUF2586 domain-containing protein [Klebsiella michiganensis]|uniref:DUF2586 domain-containing protein n=1 Tax=Klebsiella michiganensis TaxID=1134687 RepID=UPI0015F3C99B|nr:DUF2586 domain-containing protein [Klebsiella michiganensis]MCZ0065074.1 DUF2586 domain-containing protein [Klebsiella michiganensis]MCZ0081073.1 DUF2586 domain-containing protein [Klebsiella michiganensis]WAT39971.1 DUF2586 domain-containing protein [Klebsiella michiganensis]WAX84763.1 DUF2586 domain-containing protein [Klebsiella michiganensis]HDX8870164.1 DUF2586 family protein [Klebsiella michiganensis]